MKKLFVLVAALAVMTTGALAADDTPVQVAHMPNMAQEFIGQHFGDVQVSYATMDDGLRKSYDVVLVNVVDRTAAGGLVRAQRPALTPPAASTPLPPAPSARHTTPTSGRPEC